MKNNFTLSNSGILECGHKDTASRVQGFILFLYSREREKAKKKTSNTSLFYSNKSAGVKQLGGSDSAELSVRK